AGPQGATSKGRVQIKDFASIHDHWLFALNEVDPVLHAPEADLNQLAEQVRAWQRPIAVRTDTPFQLCFPLEEPPPEAPAAVPWRARYLLHARDDPSLFIPVKESWKPRGRIADVFASRNFEPREYLLTALGQAAGLSPLVETSLKNPAPGGFVFDSSRA